MKKYTGFNVKLFISKLIEEDRFLIGGQRDATLNINLEEVDTSSKDVEGGWNESIGGARGWDVSCSGAMVTDDQALEMIEESLLAIEHTPDIGRFQVYMTLPSGKVYSGQVVVTNMSQANPHDDLVTYNLSLNGAGPLKTEKAGVPKMQSLAMQPTTSVKKETK